MNPIEEEKRRVHTERKQKLTAEKAKEKDVNTTPNVLGETTSCTSKEQSSNSKNTIFGKKRDCSAPLPRD